MCQRSRLDASGRQCHLPNYHPVYIRKPCILGNIIFGGNCQPLPKRCLHSSQILCGRLVWWAWVPQLQNMEQSWSQTLSTLGWQGWPEGHHTSPSPSTQVNGKFILQNQQVAVIMCIHIYIYTIEGSLEVKLPTIWTDEKRSRAEAERRERLEERRVRRKKMQMREKVGKAPNPVFFQWFVAPEGRKVGSLKRRVRSQLARWEMKNCTPLWREAHFQVKMRKTPQLRTAFGSWDVEKAHAVVARSTFRSENVQNAPFSDHFWKLWCRKSARRCGAKHISKSKCRKHTILGPLLEVVMSTKCTPLWHEAHFEVKMLKTVGVRATFGGSDVEKMHAVVARSTFRSQNVKNTRGSDHFWRLRRRFASLHYTTLHYTTLLH